MSHVVAVQQHSSGFLWVKSISFSVLAGRKIRNQVAHTGLRCAIRFQQFAPIALTPVAGSCRIKKCEQQGRLAQLVRAPALQAGGRRFEPCTAHHPQSDDLFPRGDVVQLVRTLPCHGRGREFESRRPRHSFFSAHLVVSLGCADPSASLGISAVGSRFAHACKTPQVRVSSSPPFFLFSTSRRFAWLRQDPSASLGISAVGSRFAHACKTPQFESRRPRHSFFSAHLVVSLGCARIPRLRSGFRL